jgi:endonuclease/exonuclease/phosphatase family metal-dependent hydrolase
MIRIMSFNMHSGRNLNGALDVAAQARLMREANVDIVLLQEVERGTNASGGIDTLQSLGDQAGLPHQAFGRTRSIDRGEFGNAILSNLAVSDIRSVIVPRPGKSDTQDRGILRATVKLEGLDHHLYATHFSSSWPEYRIAHGTFLADLLKQEAETPAIVGVDLNLSFDDVNASSLTVRLVDAGEDFQAAGHRRDAIAYLLVTREIHLPVESYQDLPTNEVTDHGIAPLLTLVQGPPEARPACREQ